MYPFVISLLLFWGIAQGWAAVLTVAVTDRNGAAAGRARVFSAGSQTQTAGSFLNDGRAEFELEAGTYRVEIEYLGTSPAQVAPSTTVELVADDAKRIDLYFAKATWPISVVDRDGASSGRVLVYEVGAGGEELVLTRFFDSGGELELSLPPATYRFEVQYRGTNPAQVEDIAAADYGDADQPPREFYFGKSTRAVSVVDRDGAGGGRVQTYRVGPEGEEGVASQFFDGVGKLELSLPPGTYRSEIEYRGTNPVQIEDLTTRELGDIAEAAQEFYFGKSTQRLTVADWQGAGSGRIRTYRVGPEGEEFVASQFFNADGELELSLPPGIYRSEVEYRNTNPVQIQTIAVRQVEDADEAPRAFYFGKGEARLALRDHEGAGVGRGLAYLVDPETGTEQLVSSGSVNGAGTLDLSLPLGTYRLEVEYRGTLPYQRAETAEIVIADRTGIEKNFYFEKGTVLVEAEVAGEAAEGRVLVFRHESAGERQVFNWPLEQGRIEFELPAGIYRFVASHTAVSPIEEKVSRAVQVRDANQTRRIFFFGRDGVVGDFDGSGLVDFQDLFLFAQAWGGTDAAFDLDGNGSIDLEDFSVFTGLFGSGAFTGE